MAVQVFWDSNFKVKSLEPVLVDGIGILSPVTIGAASSIDLELPTGTKSVLIKKDVSTTPNAIQVEVSKTASPGPAVAELGAISHQLDDGDLTISTENLTYLILTNSEAASRDISFVFFTA